MSKPDEPRAAKNSGLSPSRSNSGWATANVQSTARFAKCQSASFGEAGLRARLGRSLGGHQPFGRAWYSTRVPDSSRSERSISNGLAEAALEEAELVVRVEPVALGREQLLDHRVLARGELDHERGAEARQPVHELLDRHVGADRHVVDERERQHQVGLAAVRHRPALERRASRAPARGRRGSW